MFAPVAEGEGGLDELQALLADERDRVAALLARRDMLSSEAKRVRGERDEARREQALLTEKLAEMEGRMLALKESHVSAALPLPALGLPIPPFRFFLSRPSLISPSLLALSPSLASVLCCAVFS